MILDWAKQKGGMMGNIRYFVIVSVLCFIAFPLSAEVIGTTDLEVQAIAEPILNNILEGLKLNDYAKYSEDFDEILKESISEKKFIETGRQIEDSIGNCGLREYLGFFTKGKMTVILWKARFDKSEDDVLIKLVVSKREDKYLVTGLWFQ